MSKDVHGREYAKFADVGLGDQLEVGSGFNCMSEGTCLEVKQDQAGDLYIDCAIDRHYLVGQIDPHLYLTGLYVAEQKEEK